MVRAVGSRRGSASDRYGVPRQADRDGEIDNDDPDQIRLRCVELVGVGDHRCGTGDSRRKSRVDVVRCGLVVAAVGVRRDQFPTVERSTAARQLHPVHVPPVAGVVVAEEVQGHLGQYNGVAAVATDDREHAVADAGAWQRCGQFDLAAVGAVTEPHGAGALVAFGGRRARVHDESAIAGD